MKSMNPISIHLPCHSRNICCLLGLSMENHQVLKEEMINVYAELKYSCEHHLMPACVLSWASFAFCILCHYVLLVMIKKHLYHYYWAAILPKILYNCWCCIAHHPCRAAHSTSIILRGMWWIFYLWGKCNNTEIMFKEHFIHSSLRWGIIELIITQCFSILSRIPNHPGASCCTKYPENANCSLSWSNHHYETQRQ